MELNSNTVSTFLWNVIPRKVTERRDSIEVRMPYSKTGNVDINVPFRRGRVAIVALDMQ